MRKPKNRMGLRPCLSATPAPMGTNNRLKNVMNNPRVAFRSWMYSFTYPQFGQKSLWDQNAFSFGRAGTSQPAMKLTFLP